MKKQNHTMHDVKYTANGVIERGYEIYDEWINNRVSSREIVIFLKRAIAFMNDKRTVSARVEVLACLFALDMRISENYNTILKCLFSYFSWQRETRALMLLKSVLNISENEKDIRFAIEIELQKIRENLETEEADGEDEGTRGGKSNGKSEEEAKAIEEQAQEQSNDENAEKTSEAEEAEQASEEKEETAEREQIEESLKEDVEKQMNEQEETAFADQNDKEEVGKEEHYKIKEESNDIKVENNGENEKFEPSEDKAKEVKTYNDAVDLPPLYDVLVDNKPKDKISFIDEVIMDNMIKGKEDIIGHNPLEDVRQDREENQLDNASIHEFDETSGEEREADLYDKTEANLKDNAENIENSPEEKTEQPKEQTQNNQKNEPEKQESKDPRDQLEANTTNDKENEIRREISDNLSSESVSAIYENHADAMREQLSIASAEFGIDAPVEIIGMPESMQSKQSVVDLSRK